MKGHNKTTSERNLAPGGDLARSSYPVGIQELEEGAYDVRFARTVEDVERVQRLRFEIFNLELEEGLGSSHETGRDSDRFDAQCHHMLLIDRKRSEVVGTYRLMTAEMARAGEGFYCDDEFDLTSLPDSVLGRGVELGRACILREHRNGTALFALWRGLASYLVWGSKRYLFGCCSLTSQEPKEGWALLRYLELEGHMHPDLRVFPRATHACGTRPPQSAESPRLAPPRLFQTYLRCGAKCCSPPALDRDFKTIDYFVVHDMERISRRLRALFFHGLESPPLEA